MSRRFAENLLHLRRRLDLSQQRTAERAGLDRTAVALIEHGLRVPRLDTIVRLGGALEVEPCELIVGMTWRLPRKIEERAGGYGVPAECGFAELDRPESSG